MTLVAAALSQASDEEAVAEAVPSPIDVAVPHTERQDLRHDVPRGDPAAPMSASAEAPEPSSAPPDVPAEPRHAQPMDFLESARMDREMARETPVRGDARRQTLSITAALLNMSNQRFAILIAGVALLTVGLLALRSPVFLPDFDQWGFQISCGTGFHSNFTQAASAESAGGHFVDQCQRAVAVRRGWAIPVVAAGASLLSGLLAIAPRLRAFEPETI